MEGLIPFIYKAIKERRRRSYSRCSSAGSAAFSGARAVHDDGGGVDWEQKQRWLVVPSACDKEEEAGDVDGGYHYAERQTAHRRHRSLEELAGEVGDSSAWRPGAMTRGRSVRIFSCISSM